MSGNETKNNLSLPIDPAKYLGKDLRWLPEDEVNRIIADSPGLHGTPDGYVLVSEVMNLQTIRNGVKKLPSFQSDLDDETGWIFKGSKATQEKNKKA